MHGLSLPHTGTPIYWGTTCYGLREFLRLWKYSPLLTIFANCSSFHSSSEFGFFVSVPMDWTSWADRAYAGLHGVQVRRHLCSPDDRRGRVFGGLLHKPGTLKVVLENPFAKQLLVQHLKLISFATQFISIMIFGRSPVIWQIFQPLQKIHLHKYLTPRPLPFWYPDPSWSLVGLRILSFYRKFHLEHRT